jgi:hypothetical protein
MEAGVGRRLFLLQGNRNEAVGACCWRQIFGLYGLAGIAKAAVWLPHSKVVSVTQHVDDRDAGVYFDGATVEDGGAITPLADRG